DGEGGSGGEGGRLPARVERRPAAAGGDCAGAGHAAEGDAVRRGDLGARPGADRRGAAGDAAAGGGGHDDDRRHPRDGVRAGRLRPRHLHGRWDDRRGGCAAPDLFRPPERAHASVPPVDPGAQRRDGRQPGRIVGEPRPMKITAVTSVIVGANMRNWIFAKVETDAGVVGWGECTTEWKTRAVAGCLQDLAAFLVGEDPLRIEHLWQVTSRQGFFRGGIVAMSAASGVDQALWDIAGKVRGVPVYQLLGGAVRDRVRLYDHLGGGSTAAVYESFTAEEVAAHARTSIEQGFT